MRDSAEPEVDCPIPIATLNELNRAEPHVVLDHARAFSEPLRVRLALYCYNRSHLRQLALTVASSVDPDRLKELAGTMGEVLAAQCRASGLSFGTEPLPQAKPEKAKPARKISLGGRGWTDR
ncbi:MAG: hypothetical protein JWR08_1734 [Enterovirga sp.]|jgi:hypothetical protein|nr:hypothetical protein [Enterovirga sp.]